MRLLVYPVYEQPNNPEGDSSYLWCRDLVEEAGRRGWFSYFVAPVDPELERVAHVPMVKQGRHEQARIDNVARFVEARGTPIDAVITNNPVRGLVLGRWLEDMTTGMVKLPVTVWNVSTKFHESDEVASLGWRDLATWSLGYAAHRNVMPTRFALERSRDAVRTYLGAPLVKRFDDEATVVYVGPDTQLLDEIDVEKHDQLTFYFGGRFTATKGGERAVEQYVRYLTGGREGKVVVTYVGDGKRLGQVVRRMKASSLVESFQGLSYRHALEQMSRCHVSVFWQSLKMFPSAPLEQLYAGLVVLFHRDGHEEEVLPEGYPYVFETPTECAAMLRWVGENYDEAKAKIAHVPEWVKERYDRRLGMGRVLEGVAEDAGVLRDEFRRGYRNLDSTMEVVERSLEAVGDPADMSTLLQAIDRAKPNMMRRYLTEKGEWPSNILRYCLPEGWADDCETEEPRYVRR